MPQPNQGKPGSAHVAAPLTDKSGAKSNEAIKLGVHVKGIKGSGK